MLLISGFGAHRLLAREAGLHVLELADDDKGPGRATARVRLAVAPLGELPADRLRRALAEALEPRRRSRTPSCAATAATPRRWCAT